MKVGDKVTHKNYPQIFGKVVMTRRGRYDQARVIFVKWDNGRDASQHIESALRKVGQ